MGSLIKDLRYAFRSLSKRPGFAAIAIVTLALGIGANTAIFSVVNGVLWRPLPYPNPNQLVMVWENHQARGGPEREWLAPSDFHDWHDQNNVFSGLSALNDWRPTLTNIAEPEPLVGAVVSFDMFRLLGTEPSLGRGFLPEEDQPKAANVVVLSNELWKRRFGGDAAIIGKPISLNEESYTVVGVMPAGFKFPVIPNVELWRTLQPTLNPGCQRGCLVLRAIARLKPDASLEKARVEMNTIAGREATEYPETNSQVGATIVPLHEQLVGSVQRPLLVLLGAVGFVLLIACANVANLMLARSATREKEIAIRTALGASRARVVRQLLTESALLALTGGAFGLLLAYWLLNLFIKLSPPGAPRFDEIGIDGYVLGFTVLVAVLTALFFGLVPALHVSKPDLNHSLKDAGKRSGTGVHGGRLRSALVIAEMALALILLVGGGLLMKSFVLLQRVDPGFQPEHVATVRLILNRTRYPEQPQIRSFYSELLDRLKGMPGAESVGAISTLPLSGNNSDTNFLIEGQPPPPPNQGPVAWFSAVSPDYFRTIGMRLKKGRLFTDRDTEDSPRVVVISEAMARRYWPNDEPLGKRIGKPDAWREIVGVVADVKHFGLDADTPPQMYFPFRQAPARAMNLVIRTKGEPLSIASSLRSEIWAGDKNLAIAKIQTMDELVSSSIAQQRFVLTLLGCFAALALVLAAIGIYGVMSYAVTQRTHEIGIRVALGARTGNVIALVLKKGMVLALTGGAIGLAGALGLTRLMTGLLFGVTPTDVFTFTSVPVALIVVALLACYVPARRATKVDPLVALRYE
jgi:putative ABC transport system permease protein